MECTDHVGAEATRLLHSRFP